MSTMPINFQRARKGTRVVTVEDSPFDVKQVRYGFGFDEKSQKGALVFTEQRIDMIRSVRIGDVVEENTVIIFVNSLAAISKLEYTIARLKKKLTQNETRPSNTLSSSGG